MKNLASTLVFCAIVGIAGAAQAACTDLSFARQAGPQLTNARLTRETREVCYDAFAVLHSGITRTPLWSAEHLTAQQVASARQMTRVSDFHADENLPFGERAELTDYVHSGFDRGHMTPSGDMPTAQAQEQSFSLANMVPQNAALNRGLWEEIESATRDLAETDGEVYVVTGPIFAGAELQSLHDRVLVPTSVFKAIYDPRRGAAAYVSPNTDAGVYETVSIARLRDLTGVDVFPALPEAVKEHAIELPTPRRDARRPAVVAKRTERPRGSRRDMSFAQLLLEGMLNGLNPPVRR